MGTSNFKYQPTLPTVAIDYEADPSYYREEYPDADDDEIRAMMDSDEEFFYQDLWNMVPKEVDDINGDLIFHRVELVGGYYSGAQLYVEEPDPKYLVDDLRYHWENKYGYDRASDQRLYTAYMKERDVLMLWLERMCQEYGFKMYGVYARFSNGETWYQALGSSGRRGKAKASKRTKAPKRAKVPVIRRAPTESKGKKSRGCRSDLVRASVGDVVWTSQNGIWSVSVVRKGMNGASPTVAVSDGAKGRRFTFKLASNGRVTSDDSTREVPDYVRKAVDPILRQMRDNARGGCR